MCSTTFPLFLSDISGLSELQPADLQRCCTSDVPGAVPRCPRSQVANGRQSGTCASQANQSRQPTDGRVDSQIVKRPVKAVGALLAARSASEAACGRPATSRPSIGFMRVRSAQAAPTAWRWRLLAQLRGTTIDAGPAGESVWLTVGRGDLRWQFRITRH